MPAVGNSPPLPFPWADRREDAAGYAERTTLETSMTRLRTAGAVVALTVLMSGCVAYPVGYRDGERNGYSRENDHTDCRDRRDCARHDGDRRDSDRRDSDRRDDRGGRP